MKNLIVIALTLGLAGSLFGDIQDPPANDYGTTRKVGRGLSNFFLAPAEIFVTAAKINTDEGNAASFGLGMVRGTDRMRESYYPLLQSDIPWIHAGYSEFPPELGNESKYPYVRDY